MFPRASQASCCNWVHWATWLWVWLTLLCECHCGLSQSNSSYLGAGWGGGGISSRNNGRDTKQDCLSTFQALACISSPSNIP